MSLENCFVCDRKFGPVFEKGPWGSNWSVCQKCGAVLCPICLHVQSLLYCGCPGCLPDVKARMITRQAKMVESGEIAD